MAMASPDTLLLDSTDPVTDFFVVTRDSLFEMHADSNRWIRKQLHWRPGDTKPHFHFLKVQSTDSFTYLVLDQGGIMCELRGDSLVRIDRSSDLKMQFGSVKFMMNDTSVSYGGYGLWQYQQFFTFFNPTSRSWNMLEIASDRPLPEKRMGFYGWYKPETRDFFIMGGRGNKNIARLPSQEHVVRDVWSINMTTRRWKKLGSLIPDISQSIDRGFLSLHDKLIIFDPFSIFEVDFYRNRFRTFTLNTRLGHQIMRFGQADFNPATHEVIYTSEAPDSRIYIRPLSDLYSNDFQETRLYRDYRIVVQALFMALLLVWGLVMIFLVYRKRRRREQPVACSLKEGVLRFKAKHSDLEEEEIRLLKLLASEDRFFSNLEIFETIASGPASPELLKKQKAKLMATVNQKVSILRGYDTDVFITRKAAEDKRQVEVRLHSGILTFN